MAQDRENKESDKPEAAPGLEAELDTYDLLGAEQEPKPASANQTNLAYTAKAFNAIIQQKKKQQEQVLGEQEKQTQARHALMIHTLMNIRRSLTDVARIDLGERFSFKLIKDDWQGWPRIAVTISDSMLPGTEYPSLMVSAHDRKGQGIIEISFHSSQKPEILSLAKESDAKRITPVLKRCVRSYLDLVGDVVLEAERTSKVPDETSALESKDLQEFEGMRSKKEKDESDISGDLFDEDLNDDFLETLPALEEVGALPDVQRGQKPKGKN